MQKQKQKSRVEDAKSTKEEATVQEQEVNVQEQAKASYLSPVGDEFLRDLKLQELEPTLAYAKEQVLQIKAKIVAAVTAGEDFVGLANKLVVCLADEVAIATAIVDAKMSVHQSNLATLICNAIDSLDIGMPIVRVIYEYDAEKGVKSVKINPTENLKRKASSSPSKRNTVSVIVDGMTYSAKEYISAFGSVGDKLHSHATKWPTQLARVIAERLGHSIA